MFSFLKPKKDNTKCKWYYNYEFRKLYDNDIEKNIINNVIKFQEFKNKFRDNIMDKKINPYIIDYLKLLNIFIKNIFNLIIKDSNSHKEKTNIIKFFMYDIISENKVLDENSLIDFLSDKGYNINLGDNLFTNCEKIYLKNHIFECEILNNRKDYFFLCDEMYNFYCNIILNKLDYLFNDNHKAYDYIKDKILDLFNFDYFPNI